MPFVFRWAIILVAVLFANRVIPGYDIYSYWFEFFVALVFGWLNALIRPFVHWFSHSNSWWLIGVIALILNSILYGLVALDALKFAGVTAKYGYTVFWSGVIVLAVSSICNHYVIRRVK